MPTRLICRIYYACSILRMKLEQQYPISRPKLLTNRDSGQLDPIRWILWPACPSDPCVHPICWILRPACPSKPGFTESPRSFDPRVHPTPGSIRFAGPTDPRVHPTRRSVWPPVDTSYVTCSYIAIKCMLRSRQPSSISERSTWGILFIFPVTSFPSFALLRHISS